MITFHEHCATSRIRCAFEKTARFYHSKQSSNPSKLNYETVYISRICQILECQALLHKRKVPYSRLW